MDKDISVELQQQVIAAGKSHQTLAIRGGDSKAFYGRQITGEPLEVATHCGVIDYHPSELVITARAGTPLEQIEQLLASDNQKLGFEPPLFSDTATLGGAVAAGISGSSRPYAGAVRHFVLGAKILSGRGEIMQFGGQVIKNVAGFDISRLMAGSMGCLGVILEVSLKVVPVAQLEQTLILDHPSGDAFITMMSKLSGQPLPITAAAWVAGKSRIRISGSEPGVEYARDKIGGELDGEGEKFWMDITNQTHSFFEREKIIIRTSLTPATQLFLGERNQLIDWGGAQRWFCADDVDQKLIDAVGVVGGHITRFRNADRIGEVFQPLPPEIMKLHHRLKLKFDPQRILNPGRMYEGL